MKAQHLKSKTISEDTNYQVEQLIQQLDNVKHIADSDFWISTDEIKILLSLDDSFVERLHKKVASQIQDYRFSWRNFECILVDRQFGKGFWAIRKKLDVLLNINNSSAQISTYLPEIQDPKPSATSESILLKIPPDPDIIPSPYALIDDFLSPNQLNDLLRYSISKQPEFVPTTNSAGDPNYRRSFYPGLFQERVRESSN